MLWDALCLIADTLIFFSYFTLGYIIFSVNGFIIFLVLKIKEASIFQALSSRGAIFNLFFIGLTYQPRVTSSRLAEFPDVGFLIVLLRQNQHGFFPILWVSAQLSSFLSCTGFFNAVPVSVGGLNSWANRVLFRKSFPTHYCVGRYQCFLLAVLVFQVFN